MHAEHAILSLAEALLPGGAGFPAFSATPAGPLLLARLGDTDHAALLAALAARGPLPDGPAAWTEAASRLEAIEPALFTILRRTFYLAYYEQPPAIAAIRALGHPYNDAPLPEGYPTDPFDPASDTPRHGRGRWTATDQVRQVDTAALDLEALR